METAAQPDEIDLAAEPDFELGPVSVSPSTCRARSGVHEERLEPRVMQVLVVLSRQRGRTVTRDQLVDACWGGRVVSDDAVNRVIAQVRTVARAFGPATFVLETVPKVGFRLSAAEVAETPGGVGPAATTSAIRRAPGWRGAAWILLGGVAVLVVGALAWRTFSVGQAQSEQNGRVEVIRFEARQGDPELKRFSADVGDALVRTLTRAAIDTVPRVAAPGDGASATGAELRVAGSVDRQGDDFVANTQVLDRKTGLVLTSAEWRRPSASSVGFADYLALGVTAVLDCALEDRRQSRRAMDPAVLALYFNTCDAIVREGNSQRMLESGRRLVKAAPRLAIGQALYAIAQASAADDGDRTPAEAAALRAGARDSAALALKLDPQTPKAYLAIALSYPEGGNWLEREPNFLKAREVDPNLNPGRLSYVRMLL